MKNKLYLTYRNTRKGKSWIIYYLLEYPNGLLGQRILKP